MVVYWVSVPLHLRGIVGPVIWGILLSLFVLAFSCVLGYVVARISRKLKNQSLITVFLSLLFMIGYYVVYVKAQQWFAVFLENAQYYGAVFRRIYPLYIFGRAGQGDPLCMLLSTVSIFALLGLLWLLLSRSFLRLATDPGKTVPATRQRAARRRSPLGALCVKEWLRFVKSPIYMLNCGLGIWGCCAL